MSSDTNDSVQKEAVTPEWATEPFEDFNTFLGQFGDFVDLTMGGIASIQVMPVTVSALQTFKRSRGVDETEEEKAKLEQVRKYAELAEREVKSGFALIHAQACVTLWGALEALVSAFMVSWVRHTPSVVSKLPLSTVKVTIGEYEALTAEDKPFFLAELIDESCKGPLRQGISRFETQLKALGLDGATPDSVRRDLWECNQVRNVIVHKRGVADRRLVDACPWIGVAVGEQVIVSHEQFRRYLAAAIDYVLELLYRVCDHFGEASVRAGAEERAARRAVAGTRGV